MPRIPITLALLAGLLLAGSGHAQLLPGVASLPRLPQAVGPVLDTAVDGARDDVRGLAGARALQVRALLRAHRREIDTDPNGAAVVRGEIVAIDPSAAGLQALRQAGFAVAADRVLAPLSLHVISLRAPPGRDTRDGLALARQVDPAGDYDFDHLFWRSGSQATAPQVMAAPSDASSPPVRVGLVDSGVDDRHPALAGTDVHHWGCDGQRVPDAHGTAVASLLAGRAVIGAAPGSTLFAADVYCGQATGGSAMAVVQALAWLSGERVGVVNVSLVGPANRLLERAIAAVQARGQLVIAAVGNDGPAAPPLYPAAYPGVVGVGAVNARERVLPEAGRGPQVDFVAPGADLLAAAPAGRWHAVRGTSFAAPLVARLAAEHMPAPDPGAAAATLAGLARDAILPPGASPAAYGHGVVGARLPITRAPGS